MKACRGTARSAATTAGVPASPSATSSPTRASRSLRSSSRMTVVDTNDVPGATSGMRARWYARGARARRNCARDDAVRGQDCAVTDDRAAQHDHAGAETHAASDADRRRRPILLAVEIEVEDRDVRADEDVVTNHDLRLRVDRHAVSDADAIADLEHAGRAGDQLRRSGTRGDDEIAPNFHPPTVVDDRCAKVIHVATPSWRFRSAAHRRVSRLCGSSRAK